MGKNVYSSETKWAVVKAKMAGPQMKLWRNTASRINHRSPHGSGSISKGNSIDLTNRLESSIPMDMDRKRVQMMNEKTVKLNI